MADTQSINDPPLEPKGTWQTIEVAAARLGLSVRTVNRHVSSRKLRSRLNEGRREVFVADTDVTDDKPTPASAPDEKPDRPPLSAETHASSSASVNNPYELQTAVVRADKAELAVSAYQTLARSVEAQVQVARRSALIAWICVALLTVATVIAIGWTASRITQQRDQTQFLQERVDSAADSARNQQTIINQLSQRLSEAEQRAARAEGQAGIVADMREQPSATRPTTRPSLIDNITSAFNGR